MKVSLFDRTLINSFLIKVSTLSTIVTLYCTFGTISNDLKVILGITFLLILLIIYLYLWWNANYLNNFSITIENSTLNIKSGNLFDQDGLKVISFNEYFDTIVDNKIISENSLNGIFIKKYLNIDVDKLNSEIENNTSLKDTIETNSGRPYGNKKKYKIGSIHMHNDYILAAFSKFDNENKAYLTMPDYLSFLITFWDKLNQVYAQKNVSIPIFGSGITRIKEHKNISDEDLLKIIIWTFRVSEMRFKYPAKLSIILHPEKAKKINLFEIKKSHNGL